MLVASANNNNNNNNNNKTNLANVSSPLYALLCRLYVHVILYLLKNVSTVRSLLVGNTHNVTVVLLP